MNEALERMLERYACRSLGEYTRALREILQEISLLGLWRSKFFEQAAFYGGTALRVLYGLDRFSEDMDFSLLGPKQGFEIAKYTKALEAEMRSYGFKVRVEHKRKAAGSAIQSAFLKTDTLRQLLVIRADEDVISQLPKGKLLKIKMEVDTDPPPSFSTEMKTLLRPIPFSVRTYTLPNLFAGKMHACLCRRWGRRVKGRDWYDMVWYVAHYPELHLPHLEQRMKQSGNLDRNERLSSGAFLERLHNKIEELDVDQARKDVEPFVQNPDALALWSKAFFHEVAKKIVLKA